MAAELKELLATPELLDAIDELGTAPQGTAREQLSVLHRELQEPGVSQDLLDALSDPAVEGEVLSAIEGLPIPDDRKWQTFSEAYDLFDDLAPPQSISRSSAPSWISPTRPGAGSPPCS